MRNKFEDNRRPALHMMTHFTKDVLEGRLLDLQEDLKLHRQEMGAAIDKGDEYHDNFAYEEASRQVDIASRMLSEVKQKLYDVVIIEPRKQVAAIDVGNAVVLRFAGEAEDETFTVLGPDDATQKPGWISYESPLGLMLLGKQPGDQIEYQVSRGNPQYITIKKVLPGSF
ncbi:GreA/GreB family elongation factor [Patescibacteria group bacterium]|nr:GreA/GreB family elongation factor [Patescibacteria group bacterium]MBU1473026.1 GreA/GreB family elongation factor [Patescibacteria group bacterium]MBU2460218.1 GreA/GreB family elongation factor [Patescibacteria group bacterium]MBU2543895.1 GreA/GreB family elongation factor [Patescibacteria group bacterium]